MRFSRYAAALASLSLFTSALAAPTVQKNVQRTVQRKVVKPAAPKQAEKANTKYFQEPGGSNQLGHYDSRFFHDVVSDEERTDTQITMIRAYLDFFREKGLDTWLAHGTLLGWWWNGKRLPWDWDLDTQVSGATLHHLGEAYNQTITEYIATDGKTTRKFLLDVNPWIWERERGDGGNIIDARWIDMQNGLYVDITGLSETHPDTKPGVWVCKNYHRYDTADLYPMRDTMFEGVAAKVPYAYDKVLVQEYKEKALVVTDFEGHSWNMNEKEWVKTQETIDHEKKLAEQKARHEVAAAEKKRIQAEQKELEKRAKRLESQALYDNAQEEKRAKAEQKRQEEEQQKRGDAEVAN